VSRLLEHAAKRCLAEHGLATPAGAVARTPQEAAAAAQRLGGAVAVKALVPANRRAEHGGVAFAGTPAQAAEHAARLLGSVLHGWPVDAVLVEERLELGPERYFAVWLDTDARAPVAAASQHGGVGIEAAIERSPRSALHTATLDPADPAQGFRIRELWQRAGLTGSELLAAADASRRAVGAFDALEATLVEINPLAAAAGRGMVAVGALIALDDGAAARAPACLADTDPLPEAWRPPTALEREAAALAAADPYRGTSRFVQLDGDIALLTGGGGGSLVLFDAVERAGGRPACYTEIGGNPTAEKVRGLARIVLSCPGVRGLLVAHNLTSNTQVDLVAAGVVEALADRGLDPRDFPVVAREAGTGDERGAELFARAGVEHLGEDVTLEAAARRIVERVHALDGAA
jgi:succinyl-CoA synthetase beta subunit/citryl-CoA synthetase large subunit